MITYALGIPRNYYGIPTLRKTCFYCRYLPRKVRNFKNNIIRKNAIVAASNALI
jgi:hypothetical protein